MVFNGWRLMRTGSACVLKAARQDVRSDQSARASLTLLRSLPKISERWVFPNVTDTGSADLKKPIAFLFNSAGLRDARSHDLRRTFASIAADEGYGDSTISELLGHARRGVTARHYIRRPDAALIAAADRVSARIATALDSQGTAEIVSLHARVGMLHLRD